MSSALGPLVVTIGGDQSVFRTGGSECPISVVVPDFPPQAPIQYGNGCPLGELTP